MPISRYRCKKCGKEFQVFQKITDSPLKSCSFCAGKVDLIPAPLFHNTPSFSLAFVDKEEEKPSNVGNMRSSTPKVKAEKKSSEKKASRLAVGKKAVSKPKAKKQKDKKNNKVKKMKK